MSLNVTPPRREASSQKLWAKLVLWWTWGMVLLGLVGLLIPSVQPFHSRWFEIGLPLAALLTIGANRRQMATALVSALTAAILVFLIFTIETANFEPERMGWLKGGAAAATILLVALAAEPTAITTRLPGLVYWRSPGAGLILALAVGLVAGLIGGAAEGPAANGAGLRDPVAADGPGLGGLGAGKAILRALTSGTYQEFVFRAFLLTVLLQIIPGRIKRTGRPEPTSAISGSERGLGPERYAGLERWLGLGRWVGPALLAALAQSVAFPHTGFWPLASSVAFGVGFGWLYIRHGLAFAALAHVVAEFLWLVR